MDWTAGRRQWERSPAGLALTLTPDAMSVARVAAYPLWIPSTVREEWATVHPMPAAPRFEIVHSREAGLPEPSLLWIDLATFYLLRLRRETIIMRAPRIPLATAAGRMIVA